MVYVGANEGDQMTELSGDESSLDAQVTVQRLADERAALRRVAISGRARRLGAARSVKRLLAYSVRISPRSASSIVTRR